MGDEIKIESIEIIQGGLVQIDFYNLTQDKTDRAFCDPGVFFKMIGNSMQQSMKRWDDAFDKKFS